MAQANLPEMPAGPVLELYGQRKRFTVPVGLKCMLEELTREVLRDQPNNIYEYLADYLEAKLRKECGERKRRKSWDQHRWSWEGASLLGDDELVDFLETHNLTFSSANHIATVIQAAYRGFRDRRRVKDIRTSLEKDELYLEYDGEDAYVTKDCYGNTIHFTADDVERILINYRLTMDEANKYAVKIQRTFRGYRTRESFAKHFPGLAERLKVIEEKQKKLSVLPALEDEDEEDELHKKATKIQSAFRGFKVRKEMKKKTKGGEPGAERMSALEFAGEGDYYGEYFEEEEEEEGDEETLEEGYDEEESQMETEGPGPSSSVEPKETEMEDELEASAPEAPEGAQHSPAETYTEE